MFKLANVILLVLGFGFGRWESTARAQAFADNFADRELITDSSFTITGNNLDATVEPHEPPAAGKIGGHSVWVSWIAPANGLVTLSTAGSSFDTLLGVYTLQPEDIPLEGLEGVAQNDDYGGQVTSSVQFGATAGQTYEIQVDGFNGATGDIQLQLGFLSSANLQPTVIGRSSDQALRLGDPLILTVNLIPTTSHIDLQWYLNGSQVNDATEPTLVIPSLKPANLGFYSLKIQLSDDSFFSSAIEIQVNSEGQTKVLARDKIADAARSGLTPNAGSGVTGGVVIGYNGTQIFNTTNAIVDPSAPLICGVPPGAAYWFYYQAPTNGMMTINTTNSSFPTLLAVFTYTNTLTSYADLNQIACDNNSNGTGTNTASSVSFMTTNGGNYFIVVGGVNGASGVANLNYSLTAGLPPVPPVMTSQPQPLMASAGTAVALSVVADGTGPLAYQWWKNNSKLSRQTNASLFFSSPAISDTANYFIVVTNLAGSVTSAPASFNVINSARVSLNTASNLMISVFPATRGYQYAADCFSDINAGNWATFTTAFPDYGGLIWITNATTNASSLFVRVHSP